MITKDEANKRMGGIEALESQLNNLSSEIYDRKSNVLQTYYGFDISPPTDDFIYTSDIFIKEGNVFTDIDEAMEYAKTNWSEGEF